MPLAEVKAIVPHASSQMQLRTSRDALAHVRDWGEEGDRYEARIAEEKQKRSRREALTHLTHPRVQCKTLQNRNCCVLICPDANHCHCHVGVGQA